MHRKIKFRSIDNGLYEEAGSYHVNIDDFVADIQIALNAGMVVDLSIMPGDRTHYELRVRWHNREHGYITMDNLTHDWSVNIPRYMSPCFMRKGLLVQDKDVNPWTAALMCDLATRITDAHHQDFYDWSESVPTYILTEAVPNGWEEVEKECEDESNG